jgi:hypothetical protein
MSTEHSGADDPEWVANAEYARTLLDMIIDEIQTEGNSVKSVIMYNQPLTVGVNVYPLPSYCLDLTEDAMYIDVSQLDLSHANGEVIVQQIDRLNWQRMANKAATGRPMRYWLNREASPIEVNLWPIPQEAGTIRFQMVKLFADTLEGSRTLELRQHWLLYLTWELAHHVAVGKGLPVQRCGYLASKANEYRKRSVAYSGQHVPMQSVVSHRTPWTV